MKFPFLKRRSPGQLFFLMFGIVCLLNISYTILRSARNALAVADLGGGAGSIPWFELCGTMPGAVVMTLLLTYLLNRHPIQRVFFTVFTTTDLNRESANEILNNAGFSRLVKVSQVHKIVEIPLLGTGKTNYRQLQTLIQ